MIIIALLHIKCVISINSLYDDIMMTGFKVALLFLMICIESKRFRVTKYWLDITP